MKNYYGVLVFILMVQVNCFAMLPIAPKEEILITNTSNAFRDFVDVMVRSGKLNQIETLYSEEVLISNALPFIKNDENGFFCEIIQHDREPKIMNGSIIVEYYLTTLCTSQEKKHFIQLYRNKLNLKHAFFGKLLADRLDLILFTKEAVTQNMKDAVQKADDYVKFHNLQQVASLYKTISEQLPSLEATFFLIRDFAKTLNLDCVRDIDPIFGISKTLTAQV